ncbi:DUF6320 domain-containing protein [Oceanobacillus sp. J11TS1]|uniref:DUF6320 domain-containing protein n=1 Tax=Oceanobacillus sp. J11TS1 TaxID=2807191 RepID=UPI001B13F159|nr:DUF6320 domain-containing protein [Oceanobacillus sp. J11TS1]GIO23367.1 hypothetical protein J11TS1_19480 [Oceanobacillus sp. J11TS1]
MQHYCANCKTYTKQQYCPLCKQKLSEKADSNEYYPVYETKIQRRRFAQRLTLFIAIFAISTSLLINLLTDTNKFWFLYVLGPVLYGLLFINHTILSKAHTGSKVIFQVIALSVMLFILDAASGGPGWSIHYVIPFLVTLATLLVTIIVLRKPMKWREYIGYMTTMVILGFLPVILFLSSWSTVLWPSAATALYALLTLIGMILFSEKTMKNEIVRRFHF